MSSPASWPCTALRRPHAWVYRQFRIKVELGNQTRKCDARVALDGNARVRSYSSLSSTDYNSIFRHDLTRLASAVPRLAGHRQQARVMFLQVVVLMHRLPPRPCVGAQMRRCFECRVFHLDFNVKGITPAPLRSPLLARPYGGIPPGGQSASEKVGHVHSRQGVITSDPLCGPIYVDPKQTLRGHQINLS